MGGSEGLRRNRGWVTTAAFHHGDTEITEKATGKGLRCSGGSEGHGWYRTTAPYHGDTESTEKATEKALLCLLVSVVCVSPW